jgi:hypothetical protein
MDREIRSAKIFEGSVILFKGIVVMLVLYMIK